MRHFPVILIAGMVTSLVTLGEEGRMPTAAEERGKRF